MTAHRTVIVTGGSRGIGLAVVRRLATAGYHVVAVARREGEALAAATASAEPGSITFRSCNLADTGRLVSLVKSIHDDFGPIYGLVNNAAIGTSGILATLAEAKIEALIGLNVLSPIIMTKHVCRCMMASGGSRIITISSIAAATGYSGLSVYGASKSAMVGFTKSLARELGPLGITVNAVAPGFMETEMTNDLGDGEKARIIRRSALRRLPEAADVANAVLFLLSEAARNITGTVLTVDAGSTA